MTKATKRALFVLVLLLVAAGAVALWPTPKSPTITLRTGRVQGFMDDRIAVYRGVPYAAPPVGNLRWRPPRPAAPWPNVRDATEYGPRCMQTERLNRFTDRLVEGSGMSSFKVWLIKQLRPLFFGGRNAEDCLYLNVRTPTAQPDAKHPVMVWFHGGGFTTGAGSASFYNTNGLPERDVVVVTVNYRLGVFGFFAHPALRAEAPEGAVGNYGLRDQIAALQWVRDNITAFGGDPNNVTIFGESAGAYSVAALMTSPLSRGLFHRAIGQSGCGVTLAAHARQPVSTYRAAETVGADFAEAVANIAAPTVADLRAIDATTLTEASFADAAFLRHLRPIVDGHTLVEAMGLTFARGGTHPVPWIIGWNADEGSIFTDNGEAPVSGFARNPSDAASYRALLHEVFGASDVDEALVHLPLTPTLRDAKARLYSDTRFTAPCWWAAQQHAKAGNPTYVYYFSRVSPAEGQTIGAYHAAEIPFVFDSHAPLLPRDARDTALTQIIGDYWAAFAASGDPNHPTAPVAWPVFSASQQDMLHFENEGPRIAPPKHAARYEFLKRRTLTLNQRAAAALAVDSDEHRSGPASAGHPTQAGTIQ